jgi:hypothetical protein
MLSVQPGIRGSNDLRIGPKMATFQLFFIPKQVTGPDPENRAVDKDMGNQFLPGCKCSVSQGIVTQEKKITLVTLPRAVFFPSKCPSIATAELSNTPC